MELDESAKDREILQQEIKTALEINIENAKQFEKQVFIFYWPPFYLFFYL